MIEITIPGGKTHVWTKRVGNHPSIKVLLLAVVQGRPMIAIEGRKDFEKGTHLSLYDDQTTWFAGVLRFLQGGALTGG